MKKWNASLVLMALFIGGCANPARADALSEQVARYEKLLPLTDPYSKLIDNLGNGDAGLYGTRNFRVVLNGIQYRGGANNAYLKPEKRSNENPLPDIGLENLCRQGFKTAIYLYQTNFSTAPKEVNCKLVNGETSTLVYQQITAMASSAPREILEIIYQTIKSPSDGPIYTHCWNGWHASGLISALSLRQFCGVSAAYAVKYWTKNTDGNGDGSEYDVIRSAVSEFTPFTDMPITADERALICPQL